MTLRTISPALRAANYSDVPTRLYPVDYLPYKLFATDGTYAYGLKDGGGSVVGYRLDSNYNATAMTTIVGAPLNIPTSPNISIVGYICLAGVLFVQIDSTTGGTGKRYIARSTDLGVTWSNCTLVDGAWTYALGEIGRHGATAATDHATGIGPLGDRGMCEATIDGATVLFLGEYNINTSRIAGGANDWVRIWKSTDLGINWTVAMEWNTTGHQVRHCHYIAQDPYYPQYIWVGNGDNPGTGGTEGGGGFIRWDVTAAPTWTNNWDYSATPEITGFKASSAYTGALRNRQMCTDLIFSPQWIYNPADFANATTFPNDVGIWKFDRAMTTYQCVDRSNMKNDFHAQYWGLKTASGMYVSTEIKDGTEDNNIYVYTSADGETWYRSGVALTGSLWSTTNIFTADSGTNSITAGTVTTALAGTYQRVQFTNSGGTLPGGLSALTDYWVTVSTGKVSSSYENARAGVYVTIADAGTGTHRYSCGNNTGGFNGLFEFNGKVHMSFSQPAGKHLSDSICTIVATPVGQFIGPEPEVLSPCIWVSPTGSASMGADALGESLNGYSSRYPINSLNYVLTGQHIKRGARVILTDGTFDENTAIDTVFKTDTTVEPCDAGFFTTVEGQGAGVTIINSTSSSYLFNLKDTSWISRVQDVSIVMSHATGAVTSTNSFTKTTEFRRCTIGSKTKATPNAKDIYINSAGGTIKLTQCQLYASGSTNSVQTSGAASGGSVVANGCLFDGGARGLYHAGLNASGSNNTFVNHTTAAIEQPVLAGVNTPVFTNTIFFTAGTAPFYIDARGSNSYSTEIPFDFCYANHTSSGGGLAGAAWTAGTHNQTISTTSPFTSATDYTIPTTGSNAYRNGAYNGTPNINNVKQSTNYKPNIGAY